MAKSWKEGRSRTSYRPRPHSRLLHSFLYCNISMHHELASFRIVDLEKMYFFAICAFLNAMYKCWSFKNCQVLLYKRYVLDKLVINSGILLDTHFSRTHSSNLKGQVFYTLCEKQVQIYAFQTFRRTNLRPIAVQTILKTF